MNCPNCGSTCDKGHEFEIRKTAKREITYTDDNGHKCRTHPQYSIGVEVEYECPVCEAMWTWTSISRKVRMVKPPAAMLPAYLPIEGVLVPLEEL